MYEMFNKKISIIGHSMGNFQIMYNLWDMDQEKKDKKILRYFAIAPPFIGTPKVPMDLLGMERDLFFDMIVFSLGIKPELFKKTIPTNPATYLLSVNRFFAVHKDAPWMKALLLRALQELQNVKEYSKGSIMDLFPQGHYNCTPGFKRDSSCKSLVSEIWDMGSVEGMEINPDTIEDILSMYSYAEYSPLMAAKFKNEQFDHMENPGVQVNIIYSGMIPSLSKIHYNNNPRSETLEDRFMDPDKTETLLGDGTVMAASAIAPGIKWAWEFENG